MKRLKLTPTAMSALESDVLDHVEGDFDDGYDVVRAAYSKGAITVTPENKEALNKALTELSNAFDYLGEGRDLEYDDEKKFYRAAARTFATLSSKAWRA